MTDHTSHTGPGVRGQWPEGSMTAAVITAADRVETVTRPVPPPVPGQALVRVTVVGLCGTDLEMLRGEATYVSEGQVELPWTFGHEWTGKVVAVCGDSVGVQPGQRVVGQTMVPCGSCRTCRSARPSLCPHMDEVGLHGLAGAAAQFIRVPTRSLVPVPDAVSDSAAALVEPAVTALRALRESGCSTGHRVAVVGTGTIGLLSVMTARALGAQVTAVGVDPAGMDLAARLGAGRTAPTGQEPAASFPIVVEASGAGPGFLEAVRLTEDGGTTAAVGVVGGKTDGVPVGEITLRGLTVRGIRHGLDYYDEVLDLFAAGHLRADDLIAAAFPIQKVRDAFETLAGGRSGPPKVVLRP